MRTYDLELEDVALPGSAQNPIDGLHRFSGVDDDTDPETLEEQTTQATLLQAEVLFMEGAKASNNGELDTAVQKFKDVLALEPRLAEPRLELAVLALRQGDLDEAEAQAREALERLELGWQWLTILSEDQLMSHACNLLGEVLLARALADTSGGTADRTPDPDGLEAGELRKVWREIGQLFDRAVALDPTNGDAARNQLFFRRRKAGAD